MPDTYKKLTSEQITKLLVVLNSTITPPPWREDVVGFLKKFYPPQVVSALIKTDAQYNDETYDRSISSVVAYDAAGNEVEALPCGEDDFADAKYSLNLGAAPEDEETEFVIFITPQPIPDLYIKTNE